MAARSPVTASDEQPRAASRGQELTHREHRALLLVTLAWAACLLYLGLEARLPIVGNVDSSKFAWWGHAFGTMVFAALVFLLLVGRRGRSRRHTALLALGIAVAGGILLELLQAIGGARDPTIADALVDAAGAVVAVVVLSWPRVSVGTWVRIVAVGTALMLVVAVPILLFATTPDDASPGCDVAQVAVSGPEAVAPSGSVPEPVAAYAFDATSGDSVADSSGSPALPLERIGRTSWIRGGGLRLAGGAARSTSPASAIVRSIRASGEMTALARVRPSQLDQGGPARIVTISSGINFGQVDVHLGQEGRSLSVRLRATCGEFTWTKVPNVFTSTCDPVDLAVTFTEGIERVYVDGAPVAAWRLRGTLGNWDPQFPLVVGNEATLDRPFLGDVFGVRVYDRALSRCDRGTDRGVGWLALELHEVVCIEALVRLAAKRDGRAPTQCLPIQSHATLPTSAANARRARAVARSNGGPQGISAL